MNQTQKIDLLYEAYPLLRILNTQTRGALIDAVRFQSLSSDSILTNKDCPGVIFIINGLIKIEKIDPEGNQTPLYTLTKGELCHESLRCFLDCHSLEIRGTAVTDTLLGVLPLDVAHHYLLNQPDFLKFIYQNLYTKFHTLMEHKQSLIHESLDTRLTNYFQRQQTSIIYATHQQIALELGTSREVISRKLKKLAQQGVIQVERGKIKLLHYV